MRPIPHLVAAIAALSVTLVGLELRSTGEAVPLRRTLDAFPGIVGEWQGREATVLETDVLNILKVKDYLMRRYADNAGRSVWLYIGYWDTQRKGAQMHSPKNCLPGAGWEPLEASLVTIPVASSHGPVVVNRYVIQKERLQQVVLYWYQQRGRAIAGEVPARLDMVQSAILRNRTDGALIRVSMPVYGNVVETSRQLAGYVQALVPVLSEFLPE